MQRIRLLVLAAVAATAVAIAAPAASPAASESQGWPPTRHVSVTVDMDCFGFVPKEEFRFTRTVTVSGTIPLLASVGRAFVVSDLAADVGGAAIAVDGATPSTIAASEGGQSTVQLVAGAPRNHRIELTITAANYIDTSLPPPPLPAVGITCAPQTPVHFGSILALPVGRRPPTSNAIDATIGLGCTVFGFPFSQDSVHVSFTSPTSLPSGGNFMLPDLAIELDGLGIIPLMVAEGTDQSNVTSTSVQTVTAARGGTVDLRVQRVDIPVSGIVISCGPLASGHLSSIPVVSPTPTVRKP
jgi:hypothetical protein